MNKASRGDRIPGELFKILKNDAVSAALNMSANLENSTVITGLEKVNFHFNSRESASVWLILFLSFIEPIFT